MCSSKESWHNFEHGNEINIIYTINILTIIEYLKHGNKKVFENQFDIEYKETEKSE